MASSSNTQTYWIDDSFSATVDLDSDTVWVPENREVADDQLEEIRVKTGVSNLTRDDLNR